MGNLSTSASLGLDAFEGDPLELRPNTTEGELEEIINACYRQVLGNMHILDSDRLSDVESQLRNKDISVREFVRAIAQSSRYQSLFFHSSSQYRFIELNFKHLLGRPPQNQEEIAEHVALYNQEGYEAEINSYLDSDEYIQSFGQNFVPYPRSIRSVSGLSNQSFNRMFTLLRGSATSDQDNSAKLISSVAANLPMAIKPLAVGNGSSYGNTGKRFRVSFASSKASARMNKLSCQSCVVDFSQLSQQVQKIHKSGGKITNIAEVA